MPGRLEEEISSTCIMCMLVCVPLLWKHQDLTPGRYTFLGPCSLAWHRETLTGPYDSKSLDMLSTSGVFYLPPPCVPAQLYATVYSVFIAVGIDRGCTVL